MKRRLLNLLTMVSLLACVAMAAMWVASYADVPMVSYRGRLYIWSLKYPPGVEVWVSTEMEPDRRKLDAFGPTVFQALGRVGHGARMRIADPRWSGLGGALWFGRLFGREPGEPPPEDGLAVVPYWLVAIPYWWFIAATVPLPGIAIRRLVLRRGRRKRGLCPDCGYDLRATPGRCPECGTPADEGVTMSA